MSKRPFAVFDIDGTIIRWQLYHAIADKLAQQGKLDANDFKKVKKSRMTWKTRSGEQSFDNYEQNLVQLVNSAFRGLDVAAFEQTCKEVINEYRDQVYTYTRDLIEKLRAEDYLLFIISGSQAEIIKLLANYYNFDDYGGTIYEQKDGRFTGKNTPLRSQRKPTFLKELVAKHNATWQSSIGVGDSESDIPMLDLVENPIAFNPTKKLFELAKKQGWQVVLERKNVVYRLEPKDGSYILATTNS